MKRNKKYKSRSDKRRKSKVLMSSLIIMGVILIGLVTWVGWNEWDVKRSFSKIGAAIGLTDYKTDEQSELESSNENKGKQEDESIHEVGGLGEAEPPKTDTTETPPIVRDSGGYIVGQELPTEPTFIKGILIASKDYPLPATYALGEDPVAREAFTKMASEAALSNFNLEAFSTYRSFEYQTELYERYVARDGKEKADRYSARPGYSEHQTGLAFDIGEVNYEQYYATAEFGETEAGKWVAENAHRFGFIMRYPLGKEEITGYMHEAWHFRYVGPEIAKEIFEKNITLEEYLEI